MLSSRKLLKINLRSKSTKFVIPVPLIVFYELLESLQDLLAVLAFLVPDRTITINNKQYRLKSMLKMANQVLETLRGVKYCESFDFVDIKSGDNIVKISLI